MSPPCVRRKRNETFGAQIVLHEKRDTLENMHPSIGTASLSACPLQLKLSLVLAPELL